MASNFGVNVRTSVNAARPMRIESITPIGVVGTCQGMETGLHFFGNAGKAKEKITELNNNIGTILAALDDIDDQGVLSPVIISIAENSEDAAALKSSIIEAVGLLKKAQSELGYTPNLIVAPEFSDDADITAEMQVVAERLRATAVIDLNKDKEDDVVTAVKSFGSKRVLLCDPYVKVWDSIENKEKFRPMSARVAGMIAKTDGEWEYGFADSFSNRVMLGISGTKRSIGFTPGETCEADRLRTSGVTSIIRYKGFRAWGGETTDIDSIWQNLTRVRIFDRVCNAALDGLFWAIDRRADILKSAKDSVEQMMLALKGSDVLLGFNVYWDPDKNTKANITAGKFYMVAEMQDMPIVKRLEVNFSYVDRYGDILLKEIA